MAGAAAFAPNRRMFECEGTALVPMAFEAAWLIGRKALDHRLAKGPVRIVAIDAGHLVLRNLVAEGLGELGFDALMAARAEGIDLGCVSGNQPRRSIGMNGVTDNA